MITSILPKISTCIDCVTNGDLSLKETVAARCKYHYKIHSDQRAYQKLKEKQKVRSLILSPENKKMLIGKAIVKDENLELWFKYHMLNSSKFCDNCKSSLYHLNEKEWYGSQHHVYEKSLFPSLKAHPKNHLVIGYYCCHGQVHTSILNLSKMEIFPIVKKILLELYSELLPNEQAKARNLYVEYLPELYTIK